jgi:hypothetical protein
MTGIQSLINPYDCLLSKPPSRKAFPLDGFVFSETYEVVPLEPEPPLRSQIGYATLAIPEAPNPLNLLLGLNEDGRLTCKLVEDPPADDSEENSEDDDLERTPQSWRGIRPEQLLSGRGNDDETDEEFDEDFKEEFEDMDVDADEFNDFGPYIGTDLVVLRDPPVRTREIWRSEQRFLFTIS